MDAHHGAWRLRFRHELRHDLVVYPLLSPLTVAHGRANGQRVERLPESAVGGGA
jgi:hypothetical protein